MKEIIAIRRAIEAIDRVLAENRDSLAEVTRKDLEETVIALREALVSDVADKVSLAIRVADTLLRLFRD